MAATAQIEINSIARSIVKALVCGSCICSSYFLAGQNIISVNSGGIGAALGNIKTTFTDVTALYGNQAGAAYGVGLSWYVSAEKRYGLGSLNFASAAVLYQTDLGSFGAIFHFHGYELFKEQLIGFSYSRKLSAGLAIGTQLDYLSLSIPTYGRKSTMTFELGLYSRITDHLAIGFHAYNPLDINWVEDESLPTRFSLGLSYSPTEKTIFYGEVEKWSDFQTDIKFGLNYAFIDRLDLRLGLRTSPSIISFGIGYNIPAGYQVDVASSIHQSLGVSPIIGFGYSKPVKP
ncbi:MAG: hypothetical protein OEQ53_05830 [Saprospiraceae bacterium]|nr:hypothetical protein [Saprospiraceae bacterium]